MTPLEWTATTPQWQQHSNPHRRYEATNLARRLVLERNADAAGRWFWVVCLGGIEFHLPGGDLPDDEAKRLVRGVLVSEIQQLLEAVKS